MNAPRVHAVVAAGLSDPELLARWRDNPALLEALGLAPNELDFDGLWKFAGLSLKVRYNPLRADIPLTFRLLGSLGLEVEIFARYAAFAASRHREQPKSPEEKADRLIEFLQEWVDEERQEHALIWDLIRHELALSRLGRLAQGGRDVASGPISCAAAADPAPDRTPRILGSIARHRGKILLHAMRSDPRAIAAAVRQRPLDLERIPTGSFHLAYWWDGADPNVSIVDLDAAGFYLLSWMDGKRSASELARCMREKHLPVQQIERALRELAAAGLVTLYPNPEQGDR